MRQATRPEHGELGAVERPQGLRRSRRIPAPRRRARARSPVGGDHGDEDLAVRSRPPRRPTAQYISSAELKTALEPFEKIRAAVGDRMDVMVEFHSLWQLLPAMRIARALDAVRHVLARGSDQDGQPRQPQALRRGFARADLRLRDAGHAAGRSATCSRPAPPASSCSTSPGAAAFRRRERSRRWPRPGICRSRRTIAPGRSCSAPRPTCRSTRRTRLSRRACAPITEPGTAISSPRCLRLRDG